MPYDLPFPFINVPLPGEACSLTQMKDAVLPLLCATRCTLEALALVATKENDSEDLTYLLNVIAAHIDIVLNVIERVET